MNEKYTSTKRQGLRQLLKKMKSSAKELRDNDMYGRHASNVTEAEARTIEFWADKLERELNLL